MENLGGFSFRKIDPTSQEIVEAAVHFIPVSNTAVIKGKDSAIIQALRDLFLADPPNCFTVSVETVFTPTSSPNIFRSSFDLRVWQDVFPKIVGDGNMCFLDSYMVSKAELDDYLPTSYAGQIILREFDPPSNPLIEWTPDFDGPDEWGVPWLRSFWVRFSGGYIIRCNQVDEFIRFTKLDVLSAHDLSWFYQYIRVVYWIPRDINSIIVISRHLTMEQLELALT